MYKKITHNIVEEHFNHPSVMPAGMGVQPHAQLGPSVTRYALLWNNFITFNTDLRSYIKSELTDSADNTFNWDRLNNTITVFSSIYIPSNNQGGQLISDLLTGYVNSIREILLMVKAGNDYTSQQASALAHLVDLSPILETLVRRWRHNSFNIEASMTTYNRLVIDQIVARHLQNWQDDYTAAEQALEVLSNFNQTPYYGNH